MSLPFFSSFILFSVPSVKQVISGKVLLLKLNNIAIAQQLQVFDQK
jgi:hypothetical protein